MNYEVKVLNRSAITPLPECSFDVKRILEDHDERMKRNDAVNPNSAILLSNSLKGERPEQLQNVSWLGASPAPTKTGEEIMYIHQCLGGNVPSQFSIRAIMSDMVPEIDLNHPDSIQKCCVKGDEGTVFQFALKFEDESANFFVM